jgi:cyclopropane fatty-acyl-phospholipid synthase-like methyltransferase
VLGWGALTAILEERNTGCTITCVVLTVQQLLYVRKRLPSNSNVSVILFEDFLEQNASDGAQSFDVIFAVECSEMYAAYMTSQRIQSRAGRSATPTRQELYRFFELCYIKLVQGGQLIIQSVHRVADTRSAEIKNQLSVPIVRPSIGAKWRMQKARASRWMEIKLFEHITEYVVNPFELDKRFYRNFSFVPNVHIISAPEAVPSSVDILAAATGSKFTMEAMKDLGSSDYTIAYKTWANNLDQSRVDIRTSGSVTLYDNAVNSERDRQLSEELKRQFRYYLRGAQHLFELGLFGVSRFVFSKQS